MDFKELYKSCLRKLNSFTDDQMDYFLAWNPQLNQKPIDWNHVHSVMENNHGSIGTKISHLKAIYEGKPTKTIITDKELEANGWQYRLGFREKKINDILYYVEISTGWFGILVGTDKYVVQMKAFRYIEEINELITALSK